MTLLNQKTIKEPTSFKGVGLHNGQISNISINPSAPNTGIVFKRIDLKNDKSMDEDFLNAKITTSSIYLSSILPKIESLSSIILNGDEDILSMKYNWL